MVFRISSFPCNYTKCSISHCVDGITFSAYSLEIYCVCVEKLLRNLVFFSCDSTCSLVNSCRFKKINVVSKRKFHLCDGHIDTQRNPVKDALPHSSGNGNNILNFDVHY